MNIALNNTYIFKIVYSVLFCTSLGSAVVFYNMYEKNQEEQEILNKEKESIIKDLKKTKQSLELEMTKNVNYKQDLNLEKEKVVILLKEIGNNNIDIATILKYKKEVDRLGTVVIQLNRDKQLLFIENEKVKAERDSTILVLGNAAKYNDTLLALNKNLKVRLTTPKVSIIDLKIDPVMIKSDQFQVTDKASKTSSLKINFTVMGSGLTNAILKQYYVQVIDGNGNVIGKRKSKKFGDEVLYYSDLIEVWFQNKTVLVAQNLPENKYGKGTYFVNIFDKDELVSKSSFNLK